MSTKILLINGSPKGKKSNTYKLATAFIEGVKAEQKEVLVEEIAVNQLEIKSCLGCFCCWNKTPGKCVIKDDMQGVIEKLLWADITVWSFPLYYFSVPGKLKTLIDRQLPMVLPFMDKGAESGSHPARYDMSAKRNILISTCGFYTTEGNYDAVIPMFDHLLGKGNYEKIFCSQGELFRVPELSKRTNMYLNHVKTAGQEFATGKISDDTKAKLNTLLYPKKTFEAMADASWGDYFGDTNNEPEPTKKGNDTAKTNMIILLLPWIVFWVAASINEYSGSLISIISCAAVSLLFYKNKKTIYDQISNAAVIIFAVLSLMWADVNILLPVSYLAFGLMWAVSCLNKIPLTAYYSANDYNGESAFGNPLFIKTNRILTLIWGILYIFTSVMTFFVMKTEFSAYLGIINNILPIFMGIFTAWFQKWYPAKVARG